MDARIRRNPLIWVGATVTLLSLAARNLLEPGDLWGSVAVAASMLGLGLIVTGVRRDYRHAAASDGQGPDS
jgi:hypothetical protein